MRALARVTAPRGSLTQCCVRDLFWTEGTMDADIDTSRMTRDIHEMPQDVVEALTRHRVMKAYRDRPPYQQNDYVGWITRAKLPATREKRLQQMLTELKTGGVYMHMKWNG
jgi:uncharacterized protein YdeI (YjbR/CyaY-like superfamily)